MLTVIDNFLSESYANHISEMIDSPYQEWFFQHNIETRIYPNDPTNYGFNFWVWNENSGGLTNTSLSKFLFPLLCQIKDAANCNNIMRARLDMTTNLLKPKRYFPHVDFPTSNITSIYYVIDSDGDTIIYNEKADFNSETIFPTEEGLTVKEKITPKKNRLVIFDGSYIHTGNTPQKHSNRILLNSNYN
jgi:hypothetical protein